MLTRPRHAKHVFGHIQTANVQISLRIRAVLSLPSLSANGIIRYYTLRKHVYSNILKISPPKKNENFEIKKSHIFHTLLKNIDCGYSLEPTRRGGSNEYPQSMFLGRNKEIM